MIKYKFEGKNYKCEDLNVDEFFLTDIPRKLGLPKGRYPGKFVKINNNPWEGKYIVETLGHNEDRGIYAKGEMAVAYLLWIGATSVTYKGRVVHNVSTERAETAFGKKLMESMGKVYEVIPQFRVLGGKYRIDFYIPETKQAFEYDEPTNHRTKKHREADAIRQHEIEEALGCTFIRIPH